MTGGLIGLIALLCVYPAYRWAPEDDWWVVLLISALAGLSLGLLEIYIEGRLVWLNF